MRFSRGGCRLAFVAALAFAAVAPGVVLAAPSAGDRETARGLLKDGDKQFDSREYRAALRNYEAAHAIMSLPSTGFAVAKTRAALGLLVEARDIALEVSRMPAKSGEPPAFARSRESATKLADELSRRIPSLEITLQGGPESGAVRLTLDGESIPSGSLGAPRKVNPGSHQVTADATGFKPASVHVDLAEGELKAVTLALEAEAAPEAAAGAAPAPATPSVAAAGAGTEPPRGGLSPLVYVGFGVGAAGLVTGTVTGILHLTKVSSIRDDYCGGGDACRDGFQAERDSAQTLATVANIGFGVAIVGVAVGVVGLLTSGPGTAQASLQARSRPHITPQLGPGSVGLSGIF